MPSIGSDGVIRVYSQEPLDSLLLQCEGMDGSTVVEFPGLPFSQQDDGAFGPQRLTLRILREHRLMRYAFPQSLRVEGVLTDG
jgi:hypothetical protein